MSSSLPHRYFRDLRFALWLALCMGLAKLAFHVVTDIWQAHLGYGYFRDELYYLICGRRLAWGYVDQAPLVALQARLAVLIFGKSLAGIRMFSSLAGAARVFLTGILCWQLRGNRAAQALAMLCVLLAPQYLAADSFLSMNSCESLFWISFVIVVICLQRGGPGSLWILAGGIAGVGLLNKPSMVFFLVSMIVALLLTGQVRVLRSRYFLAGISLAMLIVLPCISWQYHHDWAMWRYLRIDQTAGKYDKLTLGQFIQSPIDNLLPMTLPVWACGLYYLLRDKAREHLRWIGLGFVFFFFLMWRLGAKDYYVAPIYPVLLAAGSIFWTRLFDLEVLKPWRLPAFVLFSSASLVYSLMVLPMAIPVVSPASWPRYLQRMHQHSEEHEHIATSLLPQFYADRFGWKELVDQMGQIVSTLPPQERAHLGILCDNYGEASAINFFGQDEHLPVAISGHNNYFIWGPQGYSGDELLLVTAQSPEDLRKLYASVQAVGRMEHPLALPYEHKTIYLVRGRIRTLQQDWPFYQLYY